MPRKYKIKERRYTIEKLEEAIHKVLLREMTPLLKFFSILT